MAVDLPGGAAWEGAITPVASRASASSRSQRAATGAGDIVGFDLRDVGPELLERASDVALQARLDRLLQHGIALAHDLVHRGGLHAGGLELGERLPPRPPRRAASHRPPAQRGESAVRPLCAAGRAPARSRRASPRRPPGSSSRRRRASPSRPFFVSLPSATPALRARNIWRVSVAMPASEARVCAAEAEGASPAMRQPFFSASVPGPVQHGGLARPGVALHADHPVLRRQNQLHRVLLPRPSAAPC